MDANRAHYFTLFFFGRLVVIVIGLETGVLLYLFARTLFDQRAAAIATTPFYLCPTIIAHCHLATVDVGCMFTILLTIIALRWYYVQPQWWRAGLAGAVWGVALLLKFSAVLLLPAVLVLAIVQPGRTWKRSLGDLTIILFNATLCVNLGMGFQGTGKAFGTLDLDFCKLRFST